MEFAIHTAFAAVPTPRNLAWQKTAICVTPRLRFKVIRLLLTDAPTNVSSFRMSSRPIYLSEYSIPQETFEEGMHKSILFVSLLALISMSHAQLTIPVTTTSSPTCLGRMYTDILEPSGWGSDTSAATRFIQSNEGTLGVTIAYELRVNGNAQTYWQTGSEAMFGIGETSINRWINNENVVRIEDWRWGQDLRSKIENSSSVWHHDYHQGMGTLLEKFRTPFYNTLNGAPDTSDCEGLLYSLVFAQNVLAYSGYGTDDGHPPAYTVDLSQRGAQNAIYYLSNTTNAPSVNDSEKPYRQMVSQWQFPYPGSNVSNEYFWTLTNIAPRTPFNNFY